MITVQNQRATNANQRLSANDWSNTTVDPLVSPVTAADLADFLSLDDDGSQTALLESLLLSATEQCILSTNTELLNRAYTLEWDRHPERQSGYSGLGPIPALQSWWIEFPLHPVAVVTSVTVDGDLIAPEDYQVDTKTKPARISFNYLPFSLSFNSTSSLTTGAIVIEYTAGYAAAEFAPQGLLLGIKSLAAYTYEHRGMCDAGEAVEKSGAMSFWRPYTVIVAGL